MFLFVMTGSYVTGRLNRFCSCLSDFNLCHQISDALLPENHFQQVGRFGKGPMELYRNLLELQKNIYHDRPGPISRTVRLIRIVVSIAALNLRKPTNNL